MEVDLRSQRAPLAPGAVSLGEGGRIQRDLVAPWRRKAVLDFLEIFAVWFMAGLSMPGEGGRRGLEQD